MTAIDRGRNLLRDASGHLGAPVDLAWLAGFRILFGLLMAGGMVRFLARGWVTELYLEPAYHFPWVGWIQPLPAGMMEGLFVGLAFLGLLIAIGCAYRPAVVLFFLGFTYVELLDRTAFLNHYYFVSLICALLIILPANRLWSVDVRWRPSIRSERGRAWMLWLLRFQVGVVYLFAGVAKLNADWLLEAQPLRIWFSARSDFPLVGPWLEEVWVAYAASWFGAVFDLTVVFFLLWRRTRAAAYAAVIVFHLSTWLLFQIGMFPWVMMAAATVFFGADWPRALLANVRARARGDGASRAGTTPPSAGVEGAVCSGRILAGLAVYAMVQLALPLRTYLVSDGHPAWSYRGFNFAWQVMVAEKTGYAEFYLRDPATGERRRVRVRDYIGPRQESMMAQDPALIRLLAREIAADRHRRGEGKVEVVVDAYATLNGRPSQRLIEPGIDLASATGRGWIVPLGE